VGLGEACAIAQAEMPAEAKRLEYLRDKLKDRLLASIDEVYINGTMEHRLPNNLNVSFAYVEGESLLMGINDIAVIERIGLHVGDTRTQLCSQGTGARAMIWRTPPSASVWGGLTRKRKWTTSPRR